MSVQQESMKQEKPIQPTVPVKKEPVVPKPPPQNVVKQKIIPKKKPLPAPQKPIKEEKKVRPVSPIHFSNELVDISPSPPSIENERTATSSTTPSPPPPVVRVASPLRTSANTDIPRKTKRLPESHEEKKKKVKTEDVPHEKGMFILFE